VRAPKRLQPARRIRTHVLRLSGDGGDDCCLSPRARALTMPRHRIKAIDSLIGQRLREIRLKRGYTQGDLGKVLDVTFQQIQKFEKGDNRLSGSQLYTLARFFNVPIAMLFPPLHAKLEPLCEEGDTGGFG